MSVKCMARVWAESTVGGSELLVLLAIADHAHDDGGGAWPSLNTLARKTKLSRRSVIRVVNQLVDKGELQRDSGAGPYGTNAYVVLTGLTKNTNPVQKCYLCGEPDSGNGTMENHHPNPEDRGFTVPLCKPCHIKVHKLLGGDNLAPPISSGDKMALPQTDSDIGVTHPSDIMVGVVTPEVKTGDIAVSPKPSLTSNSKPSKEPSVSDDLSSLWSPVLSQLKHMFPGGTYEVYLAHSRLVDASNGTWLVEVNTLGQVEWLEHRIAPSRSFQSVLESCAPGVEVEFVAKEPQP